MKQKKKKILFCLRDFNHGGIPSCLLQLLRLFDHERYEVEIYCGDQRGVYKEPFKEFNVLPQDLLMWLLMSNYRKLVGWKKWVAIAVKIARHGLKKLGFDLYDWYTSVTAAQLSQRGYQVVISFAEGFPCQLVSQMNVPLRLTWVHCEYDWVSPIEDRKLELTRYLKFDCIVCVSSRTKKSFDTAFPTLSSRTCVIHNVMDVERIKSMSMMDEDLDDIFNKSSKRILSVGRVCWQKNFDAIPSIMGGVEDGVTWFILGAGPDEEVAIVKEQIREHNMESRVIMLGSKSNPYCYIKEADLLVLTSRYESYPTVVNEAKILGTPIVCRDFSSACEIMGENSGMVLPVERLHEGINELLSHGNKYQHIKEKLKSYKYDNSKYLEAIYRLIDEK